MVLDPIGALFSALRGSSHNLALTFCGKSMHFCTLLFNYESYSLESLSENFIWFTSLKFFWQVQYFPVQFFRLPFCGSFREVSFPALICWLPFQERLISNKNSRKKLRIWRKFSMKLYYFPIGNVHQFVKELVILFIDFI